MHRRRARAVAGIGLADALGDDLIALDQGAVRRLRTHRAAPAADAKPRNMAAGVLLVHEAGGRYRDLACRDGIPASGNLIAGTLNVVKAMVDAIGANASPTPLKA